MFYLKIAIFLRFFNLIAPLLFKQRFILQSNSYLELQNGFIKDVEINFSSGVIKEDFSLSLPNNTQINSESSFDVFLFFDEDDIENILCYKKAIINGNFSSFCPFLKNPKKALFNQKSLNLTLFSSETELLSIPTKKVTVFIDNTRFPSEGSYSENDLEVLTGYRVEVDSGKSYFIKTIGVAIALGVILVIFVVGLLYLMIKYKEVKKKQKEEIMNSNNDRSFGEKGNIGGISASGRKRVSKELKYESYEESKDSSLSISLNIRK